MKQFFKMAAAKNEVGRVDIYDEIGFWGTTAAIFARQWKDLEASSKRIDVHVSSPGGNLFDALTIYNIIQQSAVPVDLYNDGLAASSASLLMMAGRKSYMSDNALLMLHNPYTITVGDKGAHEASIRVLEAATEALVSAYASKSGKTADEVKAIFDAETWYGAQEAKDAGFIDKVVKAVPMAARFEPSAYGYTVPEEFLDRFASEGPGQPAKQEGAQLMADSNVTPDTPKPATIQEIKAACEGCDSEFIVAQIEASATVAQAQAAWTKVLSARVKEANDKLATSEREKAEIAAKGAQMQTATGVAPVGPKGEGAPKGEASTDPIAAWDELVAAKIKAGMPRAKAISAAVKQEPELHDAYVAAYNAQRGGNRKAV